MRLMTVVLLLLGAWTQLPEPIWRDFSSADGKFSALMPDDPKTSVVVTDTPDGKLYTYTFSATDKHLNEYMVSWTEYHRDGIERRFTAKTFDRLRDALIASKGGRLLNETVSKLEGHPGKAITFIEPDGRVTRARFYFVKTRFYQLMAETKAGKSAEDSERFLNSFRLQSSKAG